MGEVWAAVAMPCYVGFETRWNCLAEITAVLFVAYLLCSGGRISWIRRILPGGRLSALAPCNRNLYGHSVSSGADSCHKLGAEVARSVHRVLVVGALNYRCSIRLLSFQQDDIGALLNTLENEFASIRRNVEIANLDIGGYVR